MSASPSLAPAWALIPVKPFALAKSRLASVLREGERAAFARSMLEHVLGVLAASLDIGGVMVVTSCGEAAAVARAKGAFIGREQESAKLAEIVDMGLVD